MKLLPGRLPLLLLFSLCVVSMFAACGGSDGSVAGGSAVEGETVTARLLDEEGQPLVGLRVHAVVDTPSSWSLDLVTDTSGTIAIQPPTEAGVLMLSLESPSEPGRILTFRIVLRHDLDTTLTLARWGTLAGRVATPAGWNAQAVLCRGLGLRAGVVGDAFTIVHVPPGSWPLELVADSAGIPDTFELGDASMPAGGADVASTFTPRPSTVFASFDADDAALPVCVLDASATRPVFSDSCASWAGGTSGWTGRSLRIHLAGSPFNPATLLLPLPSGPLVVGTSDSLAFLARGTGLFRVSLGFASTGSDWSPESNSIQLPADWARDHVVLKKLLPTGKASVAVHRIAFTSTEDTWIVIDDLALLPGR